RRLFLQQACAATVASRLAPLGTAGAAEPVERLPIIDTHQHLWDLNEQRLPWLASAPPILRRTYSTSDYLLATQGLNVVKAVYMEVDVAPDEQVKEAERILKLCEQEHTPTVAAVVSGRPNSSQFESYLDRFQGDARIKGIRQVLHAPSAK